MQGDSAPYRTTLRAANAAGRWGGTWWRGGGDEVGAASSHTPQAGLSPARDASCGCFSGCSREGCGGAEGATWHRRWIVF